MKFIGMVAFLNFVAIFINNETYYNLQCTLGGSEVDIFLVLFFAIKFSLF